MQYKKINNLLGWLCFAIASITYILTLEPSVSFWDCGEFISCAYRLQVAHQPGYPLFAMLGKAFSLLIFRQQCKSALLYQYDVGICKRRNHHVSFLDYYGSLLKNSYWIKRGKPNRPNQATILIMGAGLVGRRISLYLHRYLLVFGCRNHCICHVVVMYGYRILGYLKMGCTRG